jgi:hypothetical protein
MTNWKEVANTIAPDIPQEQVERVSPLLDAMRAAFLAQTSRIELTTEPSYIQAVQEIKQ